MIEGMVFSRYGRFMLNISPVGVYIAIYKEVKLIHVKEGGR